jgi:hypothetical protein
MRSKIISSMAVITMLLLLAACSGGGGDDGAKPELTGQFIDSAVTGLYYEASPSGLTGTTDVSGTFKYKAGDTIEFYVGDILIGSASAVPIMTPVTLVVGAVDETHSVVISIAAFLQSLDSDGNLSNGIQIEPAVAAAAEGKTLDFNSAMFAADAAAVLAAMAADAAIVGFNGTLVDPGDAMNHLGDSISTCEHTGTYSGTWVQTTGPDSDNGTWTMSVSATGNVTGSGASNIFLDDNFTMTGSVSPDGTTTAGSTDSGAVFSGTVAADGTLSGSWSNSSFGSSGTFAGTRVGSAVSCSSSSSSDPAPGSGDTPIGGSGDFGSLTMSDQPDAGTVFNAQFGEANLTGGTGTITWLDFEVGAMTSGTGRNLTLLLSGDTPISLALAVVRGNLAGGGVIEEEWAYTLDCTVGDCSGISINSATQEVSFSGVALSVAVAASIPTNSATGPITLNGTLSYATPATEAPGGGSTVDTSAFAGIYTGTYTGEDTGNWTFIIDAFGGLTGTVISDTTGSGLITASVSSTGVISGNGMTGTVSTDGSISGTWPGTPGAVGNNYSGSRISG